MPKKIVNPTPKGELGTEMRKIRVLRVIARMNIGGPAVQVTGLMRNLNSKIFEQLLVTGFVSENEADYLLENQIDIPVLRIDGLGRSIRPLSDFLAFFKLAFIIRKYKPDIIHTHTAKAGVLGRTAWILLGHKPILIHTFHGHLLQGYFGSFKTKLVILIETTLAKITNVIFGVGNQVVHDLIKAHIAPEIKFQTMPPGLRIEKLPSREQTLQKYQLKEAFYCTYLGRVTKIKNPKRLLDTVEIVQQIEPKIKFLIAGSGELLESIKSKIVSDKLPIECLGWVSNVEEVLAITNLMVLTSENEGMPLSLIQAGMAGIPAVATDVGSVSEVIINNQTGLVVDLSSQEIAAAILELFKNRAKYTDISNSAKEFCLTNFSIERLCSDHENAYLKFFSSSLTLD